jgi:hypothetical protein
MSSSILYVHAQSPCGGQSQAQQLVQTDEQFLGLDAVLKHLLHGMQNLSQPGQPSKAGVRINEVESLSRFFKK